MDIKRMPFVLEPLRVTVAPPKDAVRSLPATDAVLEKNGAQPAALPSVALQPVASATTDVGLAFFSPLMTGLSDWSQRPNSFRSEPTPASSNSPHQYGGSFSLQIKTRDGDTVTLRFGESRAIGEDTEQTSSALYQVDGELSEAERKALDKVVAKMVGIAETYFSSTIGFGRMAVLDDLSFFDAGQLASFALDASQARTFSGAAHTTYSSLSLDYSVDLKSKSQRLSSEFVMGYRQHAGAGQQRFGYDVETALNPLSQQLLNGMDVRGFGKPGVNQSAPTALPAYYQGALQALAGNVDQLAKLVEAPSVRSVSAKPKDLVTELFSGLIRHHPAYRSASRPVRESLDRMLGLLPSLLDYAQLLNTSFFKGSVRVRA